METPGGGFDGKPKGRYLFQVIPEADEGIGDS